MRHGVAGRGKVGMVKQRWHRRAKPEIWKGIIRPAVWRRDKGICQSPVGPHKQFCINRPMTYKEFHTDHIIPVRAPFRGVDDLNNLRTLCPMCHALRKDRGHQGMVFKLLQQGKLPPNWREFTWE